MTELAANESFDFETPVDDPALVAAALAIEDQEKPPEVPNPIDGPVTLVSGYRRVTSVDGKTQFEDVTTAWVRELNGEDEERIARTRLKGDHTAFIRAVLDAGVEKLGDKEPTPADFDAMVVGDRDYLLMEIARATYGDSLQYDTVVCPGCAEEMEVTFSLAEDIPISRLTSMEERTFEVELRGGRVATVTLPTGEMQGDIAKAETPAEANTVLIAHSVHKISGPKGDVVIQGDVAAAKRLGIVDRRTLVTAMSEHMPGPQYNEVRFKHDPGCGEEIRLQVTLADLFRDL